jgi:hypothetical protein
MILGEFGSSYPLASKSGWTRDIGGSTEVVHDMAIVFAPNNPFILVVMSANRRHYMDWVNAGHNARNFRDFNEILHAFERYNRTFETSPNGWFALYHLGREIVARMLWREG